MQRLLGPSILTLSLAVPTASQAVGLGDIRVDSALHQPLVAQIELVGAADDELGRLSAAIAGDELFQKYNLERAPFIFGTTVTVGRDAQGRPVLKMRSTEKFTEPVVTLLVDLHTPAGELVREYTLFLDPAGLVPGVGGANMGAASIGRAESGAGAGPGSAASAGTASTAAGAGTGITLNASPVSDTGSAHRTSPTRQSDSTPHSDAGPVSSPSVNHSLLGQTYTVARRDTLDRIVTATGARSRTERHRMMVAIYRANPAAFQGNFNRMHTGVTLTFPTAEQLAAISVDETNTEYDVQMASWRASRGIPSSASAGALASSSALGAAANANTNTASTGSNGGSVAGRPAKVVDGDRREGTAAARAAAALASTSIAMGAGKPAPNDANANSETMPTDQAALKQRVASLEQSLAEIQRQLKQPLPVQVAASASSTSASPATSASAPATLASAAAASVAAPATSATAPVTALAHHAATEVDAATAPSAAALAQPATVPAAVRSALTEASIGSTRGTGFAAGATAIATSPASLDSSIVADESTEADEETPPTPQHRALRLVAGTIGAVLLFVAGAWFYLRRRNSHTYYTGPKYNTSSAEAASNDHAADDQADDTVEFIETSPAVQQTPVASAPAAVVKTAAEKAAGETTPAQPVPTTSKDVKSESSWFEDSFSTPIADLLNDPTVSLAVEQTAELAIEPTVKLPAKPSFSAKPADETSDTEVLVAPELDFAGDTVEQKFSFFNPEATTNTEHVVMGSALNEPKSFVERRKNPADVLRQAIEREPDRSDLRLKLLELYYTAAAENRRAFLEATRQLTKNEKLATPEDWARIADMGRIIAPDDKLFAGDGEVDDKRVA